MVSRASNLEAPMPHLVRSHALQRPIRLGPLDEMGDRTEAWLITLIESRRDDQAYEVAGYLFEESAEAILSQQEVWTGLWTWIADNLGEDALQGSMSDIAELDKWQQQHMA